MELTTSQKNAVNQLVYAFKNRSDYKISSFKAPTGSGKTFMASSFISQVFALNTSNGKKSLFIVATVSNAELPKSFARKLNDYQKFHDFNNYKIEYIQSPSSTKTARFEDFKGFNLENNKVFVFGVSSFGKNSFFYQNKTLENLFIDANNQNYEIYYIRDEAHIGTNITKKEDLKNFNGKMVERADFVVQMTATPKDSKNLIELTKEEMSQDGVFLLKEKMEQPTISEEKSNSEIIDEAIAKFKESKASYQKLKDVVINPAMLVQIMNESDYKIDPIKNQQFHEGLIELEQKLKTAGLKYLKYLNQHEVVGANLPPTLEFASKLDSPIDVIIFKIGPATGWDIPRANMLLQLRSVSSEQLNVQTVGRIMRNPYPGLVKNETTNKFFVWSNYQKPSRDEAFYKIKDKFFSKKFYAGKINQNNRLVLADSEKYCEEVINFLDTLEFRNKVKDVSKNQIIYGSDHYGAATVVNRIPNHIYLKIYNIRFFQEYEKSLILSLFEEKLTQISVELKRNIEIVKYVFGTFLSKLSEIKGKNTKWVKHSEPYELLENVSPLEVFSIWVDNVKPKEVNTKAFVNYGYVQITGDENVQFLDSTPELSFYKNFMGALSSKQMGQISFFAKMPTLGSKIYFEYFSQSQGRISKSFMDFAIEYKDRFIFIEVKSRDADYNSEKTKELHEAYRVYMKKFHDKKISLVLYEYDKISDVKYLSYNHDGDWKNNASFRDAFDYLLKD